ncbi:MAG: cellulase family glycosylhydrolase [Planctomycetaceae bacterium]|jgi:hypothetical protein|nr:cellulase family glycosylhydrolase [Planctomycetaceae bacterium]
MKHTLPVILLFVISAAAFAADGQWSAEKANDWAKPLGWLTGTNYISSNSVNSIEMFDKTSYNPDLIDKELTLAEDLGFNTVRVLVPYILYEDDAEYLHKTFDHFLGICEKHKIKVMPVLFDDCIFEPEKPATVGKQSEPVIGWYAWGWRQSPGRKMVEDENEHPKLEKYVKNFIGKFKDDSRILAWDVYNEPTNRRIKSIPLVKKVFAWARAVNPSQPLTAAAWNGNAELNKIVADNSDVITFHCYGKQPVMMQQIAQWKKFNRPVWCTEWLNRPNGSVLFDIMPELKKNNVGSYIWGLVQGKTQTHLSWGHRPEKLPYTGLWQHDLYNTDFTPYKQDEIDFIKQLCKADVLLEGQWSIEKATNWYAAVLVEKTRITGVNFLPSTAVNDIEMWQSSTFDKETIDKELSWAENWGINSVRVFLNYGVWEAEAETFKKNFAAFLDIAEKHKISVMPILFDDCNFQGGVAKIGKQPEPVPGVHNSGWVSSPPLAMLTDSSAEPKLKAYLQDMVKTFGQDKRILVWDLYNEPGNSGMGDKHFDFIKNTFVWAREMKPLQPLTIGAWRNFNNRMNKMFLSDSDVISFHGYDKVEGMKTKIAVCERYCRPVFCTEWLLRQNGDNLPQKMFPLFAEHGIGIYNWGLVAGRTQTYFHWGSKKGTPEPAVWQHDLIKADGMPYRPQELPLFRKFASGDDSPLPMGEVLTPTADLPPVWKYTERKPADDWISPDFDDSAWKSGAAPFGAAEPNIARSPNTVWKSNKIYLRRTFELSETQRQGLSDKTLELRMYYDESPVVYLNGVKIKDGLFYTNQYETFTVDAAPLKTGRNVLAIECSNTTGGQYIDAGLIGQ